MNRDELERLVRIETKQEEHALQLQEVKQDIRDSRDHNDKRIDELKEVITLFVNKPVPPSLTEKVIFGIGGFVDRNWSTIIKTTTGATVIGTIAHFLGWV